MRVLVVDDDIIIRHFFIRSLRRYVDVEQARGVVEALSKLRSTRFDAVIADEYMPDGSGRALLAQVRALQSSCRRALISADEMLVHGPECEEFFPKIGGLARSIAWIRVLSVTTERSAG